MDSVSDDIQKASNTGCQRTELTHAHQANNTGKTEASNTGSDGKSTLWLNMPLQKNYFENKNWPCEQKPINGMSTLNVSIAI